MPKKREYWIDVMRAFACVMVLFCHAPAPIQSGSMASIAFGMVNAYLGMALGPVLFFMISGACILNKKATEVPVWDFFKRRFSRILVPTIVWSVIYVLVEHFIWQEPAEVGGASLLYQLAMIPFLPQYGLMWFMYALVAIYLMAPILSAWLIRCSKRDLEIYLLIWSFTLLIPYLKVFVSEITGVTGSNGMLHYINAWLWIAILGYYCRTYVRIEQVKWYHAAIVFAVAPVSILAFKALAGETITNCLSFASVFTTAGVFVLIQNIHYNEKLKKTVELFSKLSFGIYLSHMLFTHPFRLFLSQYTMASYIQIPLTVLFSGICAFVLVYLISKLPFSKFIIG